MPTPICHEVDTRNSISPICYLMINLPVVAIGDLPDWLPTVGKLRRKHGWPPCKIKLRTLDY
jgi:hypothetical protein